ncbi:MAG TPA: SprT-like domain-containing protein [Chthoniobacteraceae bacterium]|nr:SprT-like domain-containing protein [Chthoniobacteraceae bacterium]
MKATPIRRSKPLKRKACSPRLPMQRQFDFPDLGQGRFFHLGALFQKLNARYFRNRLKGYRIVWGRKRKGRPRDQIVFGTIQEDDRIIRIHPLLDRALVPTWFLEYVIYHEMCHAVVRDEYDPSGRRIVHHEKFFARERQFHWFRRAKVWEQENLARFLQ